MIVGRHRRGSARFTRTTRTRLAVVVGGLAAVLLAAVGMPAAAAPVPVLPSPGGAPRVAVERSATTRVTALTGTGSASDTGRRFGVEGTDLGHMIAHKGRVALVFGDTYGAPPADPFFSVKHQDWRSNTMGWLDPAATPGAGLKITDMVTDRPGHAKELIGSRKRKGIEETVIPTGGVSVGGRLYLHRMSVKQFEQPGRWTLNSAGVSVSDDDGRTWAPAPGAVWPGNTRFGQVAYVDPAEEDRAGRAAGSGDGANLYVYGIPGGRYGALSLARVPRTAVADRSAYRYWTGSGWSANEGAARDVVPGPVGELSVRYHPYYRTWLMMYLVDPTGEIVLRTADSPTGPWSEPQVVLSTKEYPEAYAPYLTPMWNDGPDVWFTMSQYGPYRVSLMRTRLSRLPAGLPLPLDVRLTPVTGALLGPRPPHPFERQGG